MVLPPSRRHPHPVDAQRGLYPLELPQLTKHGRVGLHCVRVEDGVDRGVDLVFELEAVPPNFAVLERQQPCVEPAEDVGGVILRVGAADGGLELGGEVVPVEMVGRA